MLHQHTKILKEIKDILINFVDISIQQFKQQQQFNEHFLTGLNQQQYFNKRFLSKLDDIENALKK